MRTTMPFICAVVATITLAFHRAVEAVVIDVSGVKLNTLFPSPIPAGKRVTSFSYEYDYNKESNASVSASFALSITLSTDAILGGVDDILLGTLNTATGSVGGASGHVSTTTWNPNGFSALLVPLVTPPGVYNAFLQIAPRSPHTDPDSIDAIGQLPGTVTVIAAPNPQGDYNYSGVVDAADYVLWRNFVGQTGIGMSTDGNGNDVVDGGDFDTWRSHFGQATGSGTAVLPAESRLAAVPELSTWTLLTLAAIRVAARRRRFAGA